MFKLLKSSCEVLGLVVAMALFQYLQCTFWGVTRGECSMVFIGIVGVTATVAAAGISMYGQKKAAKASAKAGREAAQDNAKQIRQAAEDNARLANSEAVNVELESREQISRMGQEKKSSLATMRASMGASGFTMDSGSNLDLMGATAGRLAVGIADVGREAGMRAAKFRYDGARGLYEADAQADLGIKQANTEAKNIKSAAKISMIATGVGGIASAATGIAKIPGMTPAKTSTPSTAPKQY